MVIWGAIWGAILGIILPRHEDAWTLIAGGLIGALIGLTLRRSVRSEFARLAADQSAKRKPAPMSAPDADTAIPAGVADAAREVAADLAGALPPTPVARDEGSAQAPPLAARAPVTPAQSQRSPQISQAEAMASASATAPPQSAQRPPEPDLSREPDPVEKLVGRAKAWLFGGNTVARVGAIVLFIGLSFLAKWAADNALFPPELRLAAVGIVGIALLVQGFRLSRRVPVGDIGEEVAARGSYAYLLQGAGVAVLYLTIFAAFKLYAMIPALAAFVLMALVCALSTLLALLSDKQMLAFVGFAGAFATPILVSTGSGNHAALFSYYLLLNLAIGIVAWLRAWRALNLLGFFATFGVATLWGALKYVPENYASTQPFLIAFFAIYALIGLFYALRHARDGKRVLDGIIIFGTPIVSFLLQTQLVEHIEYGAAISAVTASAIYLALALFTRGRSSTANGKVAQWLTLSYAALALVFATLAVPLAVDGRMTAAIWAIEGAGVFWLATRQRSLIGQLFGVAMQLLAASAFLNGFALVGNAEAHALPFANASFVGHVMLALGGLLISWWSHSLLRTAEVAGEERKPGASIAGDTAIAAANTRASNQKLLWQAAHALLFVAGFGWLVSGFWGEVSRVLPSQPEHIKLAWFTLSFMTLALLAWTIWRRSGWRAARYPAIVTAPFLLVVVAGNLFFERSNLLFNVLLWPACLLLHLLMLRGVDDERPRRWWPVVHVGNVLLMILMAATILDRAIDLGQLRGSDWAAGILLTASTVLLLALASARVWADTPSGWPLDRFQRQYALQAGGGVAALTLFGALLVACTAPGNAAPLPYLPLLNPVDLIVALALTGVALWLKRARNASLVAAGSWLRSALPLGMLAFAAFIALNTVWLRFAHHFRDIAWNAHALGNSFFVQAGYSVLWTLLGVAAMLAAHRRQQRMIWQAGAALLGLTVVKLLLVDLANSGGGERIVAFIGVGLLMVAVGYFAPLPPAAGDKRDNVETNHA